MQLKGKLFLDGYHYHTGSHFTPVLSWLLFSECLRQDLQGIGNELVTSLVARLNVIRVGNHALQIYNSLLIDYLTLNLTMTNYWISELFYRLLTLSIFPIPP